MPHNRIIVGIVIGLWLVLSACSPQRETQAPPETTPIPTNTAVPPATELPEATTEPTAVPTSKPETRFTSERAAQIAESGIIRIGVRSNSLPPFILVEGEHTGFEIELANAIVEHLFGGAVEIEWIDLEAAETFSSLQENRIDVLVRTIVHTQSRDGFALWSDPYFIGGLRMLVREGEGITSFADLDGKRVSVTEGTNVQEVVRTIAVSSGIGITEIATDSNDAAIVAFEEGEADAYVNDWTFLLFMFGDEPSYQIVGDFLTRQPFAMGLPLGEEDFQQDVNGALRAIVEDGTYDSIYDRWFNDPHPWTLEEMLSEPPMEG